ncbi:MAG: PilZ domain-containing protein, partial [Candidatus Omnitrophica bacterium]|nr:PilZ domain-containing protein [Candidatus Omnitrophota bacterium]
MQWDGLNRRRFVRVQYPFTVHIYLPDRPPISTYTEDVSEGGIKVTVRENIPLEVSVDLEIYLRSEPIICKGKVTWVGERISQYLEGVKLYDTGFEFFKV